MSIRIIFLDIDGPMIPFRAYYLPNQTKPIVSIFDPCATSMLLRLLDESDAKLVISSSWGVQGYNAIVDVLETNGISRDYLHSDWITPRETSSYRCNEIRRWLDNHPEVTHYVAIDDESLPHNFVKYAVKCDTYEGFSWRNYWECRVFLSLDATDVGYSAEELINRYKRSEITRTVRRDDPRMCKLVTLAEELFPHKIQPENMDENN